MRGTLWTGRFKSMPLGAVDAAGGTNRAAHRRSNLLSRSTGISHITKAPGLLSPPGQGHQRAPAFKGPSKMASRGISAGAVIDVPAVAALGISAASEFGHAPMILPIAHQGKPLQLVAVSRLDTFGRSQKGRIVEQWQQDLRDLMRKPPAK